MDSLIPFETSKDPSRVGSDYWETSLRCLGLDCTPASARSVVRTIRYVNGGGTQVAHKRMGYLLSETEDERRNQSRLANGVGNHPLLKWGEGDTQPVYEDIRS